MKIRTKVKAGGRSINHNETLVRDSRGLRVKTNVKAGGLSRNHNETFSQ